MKATEVSDNDNQIKVTMEYDYGTGKEEIRESLSFTITFGHNPRNDLVIAL